MCEAAAMSKSPKTAVQTPWDALDASGQSLAVGDFITTMFSHTANGLRRTITVPYADAADLTVSEWRMLSVLAHAGSMPFTELVLQAVADKAQVSRSMRLLEGRGLVLMKADDPSTKRKLTCYITKKGQKLYEEVMPIAQRTQAEMILSLTPQERHTLYVVLRKLMQRCGEEGS